MIHVFTYKFQEEVHFIVLLYVDNILIPGNRKPGVRRLRPS